MRTCSTCFRGQRHGSGHLNGNRQEESREKENFGSLYRLLNKELEGHFAGLYQRFEEMGLLEPDEKAA